MDNDRREKSLDYITFLESLNLERITIAVFPLRAFNIQHTQDAKSYDPQGYPHCWGGPRWLGCRFGPAD
jgi:hypothetical protein